MTDVIGALGVLIQIERPEREEALDRFYERHRQDHLLVDKWLALNAQVPNAAKLELKAQDLVIGGHVADAKSWRRAHGKVHLVTELERVHTRPDVGLRTVLTRADDGRRPGVLRRLVEPCLDRR